MNYNIYKCEYKNEVYLTIASDLYIFESIQFNSNEKSELVKLLEKDNPLDCNVFKAEPYSNCFDQRTNYDMLILQDTINEKIVEFNDILENIKFLKIGFFNAKIDDNYFLSFYLAKEVFINDLSKGKLELNKYHNIETITVLPWNKYINFTGDNNKNKQLVIWKYNPKSKRLKDLLNDMEFVDSITLNQTNIETLEGIEQLRNLKSITIEYGKNLKSVKVLNKIKTLEFIFFNNCKKIEDFEELTPRANLIVKLTNVPG